MAQPIATHINSPLIIFDGQCSFCRRWVERARSIIGSHIDFEPFQTAAPRFPQIDPAAFGRAVHLVEPDGRVSRAAAAVYRALQLGNRYPALAIFYKYIPGFSAISEAAYKLIAAHRETADGIDMLLIGTAEQQPSYLLTRQIFLRLLGVIYFIAFVSLWHQIDGLIGSRGILPIHSYLSEIQSVFGTERFWFYPTLCWLNSSDHFLHFLCAGGVVASLLLITGIAQIPVLITLFAFYLSLVIAGQDFLGFQWDALLLESGFLAIFFAPAKLFSWRLSQETEPSRAVLLLLRWLLSRLIFLSGVVKLASRDSSWRNWTALRFHYMTQPLPTWTSWYFFQLPPWFQTLSCGVVFAAELVIPFLFFAPRRIRLIAFWATIGFQLLIAATGNYGFFNLLTIALCCTLPDDSFWKSLFRRRAQRTTIPAPPRWRAWITLPLSAILLSLTIPICINTFGFEISLPYPINTIPNYLAPFRVVSGYGLFAVMTTTRPEIIIEGSDDHQTWKEYPFKWKPGDVNRSPAFATPYMPRLDWQMWFAAQGDPLDNPWIIPFLQRIREGSEPVLQLLQFNPFPTHPPKYIRAILYDYQMTDFPTRHKTSAWWTRRQLGLYYEPPPRID
jgi:lipase maturation factor 1